MGLRRWFAKRVVRFLTRPLADYARYAINDLDALKRQIRKGDVLLSQGDQRISAIIMYLTQSPWSHAMLYVGDEILERGGALADRAFERYGDEARYLLVDALPEGVTFTPLSAYVDYNIRLCRPHRLRPDDLKIILDDAIGAIGWHYDLRNIVQLAWHYLPAKLVPSRFRRAGGRLGSTGDPRVICTSLCGELFDRVGFPVLPSVTLPEDGADPADARPSRFARLLRRRGAPLPGIFRRQHPSQLAPRDFDLSPYFEVIKFNVIGEGHFDYQQIRWAEDESDQARAARTDAIVERIVESE
ncbi:MAG: lipo-like protein [Deltaproteobacteria bacterium]|nr:MAG: lipo-like protein [Deltaproteobacteria bacterium]